MHPDDRVLVAVMSRPKDFEIAREQGWYRVPEEKASRGVFFEYVALYFTAAFGDEAWAVHWYAARLGEELVRRRDLLPDEPDHPRADERYYRIQIGPLHRRVPPIPSLRWRRVTFIHTTWDRFVAAQEINDLFCEGGEFVDRLYHALREADLRPERCYPIREAGGEYISTLAVPCREGVVAVELGAQGLETAQGLQFTAEQVAADPAGCVRAVRAEVQRRGGLGQRPAPAKGETGPGDG